MRPDAPLVILGCGFAGTAAAKLALAAGTPVVATTRREDGAAKLRALGIDARALPTLGPSTVDSLVPAGAYVLVGLPPDGVTDAAIAPALGRAGAVVYVSSTGVYGSARGRVDENTPLDLTAPEARARAAAEDVYRAAGAVVLRAAGIYGPLRGLHRRLLRGELRMPEDGARVVSRIHVDDLAALCLAALDRGPRGATFVVADDAPVPQSEVIAWLCARLAVPLPPPALPGEALPPERQGRAVINARVKSALGVTLHHPTYREGYAACLAAEHGDTAD